VEANNGIRVGPVTVLVQEVARRRSAFEAARDLAASLLVLSDVETKDWLVSVHDLGPRGVLASRRFDSRHRAERARTDLVAVAATVDEPDSYDWPLALART
jgi:hypothetical protein